MSFRQPMRLTNKQKINSQYIFTKLSVLEIEKKIVGQERKSALQRIEKIDSKLKKINANITSLLACLDLHASLEVGSTNHNDPTTPILKTNRPAAQPEADTNQRFIMRY